MNHKYFWQVRFIVLSRVLVATLLIASPQSQAKDKGMQELLFERAPQSEWATIPLSCWPDFSNKNVPPTSQVVGTGFLVNDQGYFITAAHVAKIDHVGTDIVPIPCTLKAVLRQTDGNGFAAPIETTEVDNDHDLALCHIQGFFVRDEKHELASDKGQPKSTRHPFASFVVESSGIHEGEMVLLSGF